MSRENVEVIRDLIAAINERDFERAIAHHTDDVVLEAPAGIRGGTFRGREAVSEWYADWFRIFDWNVHADIREIAEFGEDGVLLVSGLRGRGRHSGVEAAETFAWLYRLREGKVTRVEGFLLREEALEAAGLREWAMSAENVEVVRQAYDALNALLRGEIAEENAAQVAQRFFDPQFEQDWPLGQEWPDQPPHFRGILEMMSFIEQVRSAWVDLAFEPL